jgi:hypothetical protein
MHRGEVGAQHVVPSSLHGLHSGHSMGRMGGREVGWGEVGQGVWESGAVSSSDLHAVHAVQIYSLL